ncbi:type-1 angiotensin II receptor B-like [Acanthochromis polyacanthus]|uniref:type-1 angiotensin II receptor B-like n=1 Tax=Acanthochromis polyacanthus TaxID=80966 RepID=UPI002234D049|nr:type-1 angiotensin II receptor B-like [Acanthochromis polyacanthus]
MEQLNFTVLESNTASSSPEYQPDVVPAVLMSIFFLVGVPGNIAVVLLRPSFQHLSSLSQSLMLNLAFSDILCLLTLPVWIYMLLYSWTFGLEASKVAIYLVYCSVYSSQATVTMLAIQRYLLVVRQKKFLEFARKRLLVLLWLVAVLLSIPAIVFQELYRYQTWSECVRVYSPDSSRMAALLTESVAGFISLFVVAFAYIQVRKKVNQAAFFNNPQTNRLVTSIIVTSFVLWVPYHIVNVLYVVAISLKIGSLWDFFHKTWGIVVAVTFVNSCLNPLLYAFASYKMRQTTTTNNETAVTTDDELQE